MYTARKVFSVLLVMLLVPALWGQMALHTARALLTDPNTLRQAVRESGVYRKVADGLAASLAAELRSGRAPVPLTQAEAAGLVREVLPEARLQSLGDTLVDGLRVWLPSQTARPEVILDLSDARKALPGAVRRLVEAKVGALPVCTKEQAAQLVRSFSGGMPPCRSADQKVNQALISQALPQASMETLLPARLDVAAELEVVYGPWFWDEAARSLQEVRLALALAPWGWAAIGLLLLLLALLNLDRWYAPFGWVGTALLIGGGVLYLGAAGVVRLLFADMVPVQAGTAGDVAFAALTRALAEAVGLSLRNLSLIATLTGLGLTVAAVAGALTGRRKPGLPA